MKERDHWKEIATSLSLRNIGQDSSKDEKKAWEKVKSLRNKVNNKKKNEEHLYKKQKVYENITDS